MQLLIMLSKLISDDIVVNILPLAGGFLSSGENGMSSNKLLYPREMYAVVF